MSREKLLTSIVFFFSTRFLFFSTLHLTNQRFFFLDCDLSQNFFFCSCFCEKMFFSFFHKKNPFQHFLLFYPLTFLPGFGLGHYLGESTIQLSGVAWRLLEAQGHRRERKERPQIGLLLFSHRNTLLGKLEGFYPNRGPPTFQKLESPFFSFFFLQL